MDEKDLLIAQLRKENAALRQMIEDLQKQVKNLTEAVLLLRKNRFGSKSERTRNLLEEDGQLNLFNEIELEGDPKNLDGNFYASVIFTDGYLYELVDGDLLKALKKEGTSMNHCNIDVR